MFELSGVNYEEVLEQGDSILVRVIASSSYRRFELSGLYCTLNANKYQLLNVCNCHVMFESPLRRGYKGVEHISTNLLVNLSGAGSSPAGSVGRDLNLQKPNYQYLTTSVAVVLVVRWYFNGWLVLFCVQCCVCRKLPRCISELVDSAWVVTVPGQKCIKQTKNNAFYEPIEHNIKEWRSGIWHMLYHHHPSTELARSTSTASFQTSRLFVADPSSSDGMPVTRCDDRFIHQYYIAKIITKIRQTR